jgi:hypothetical protein
MSSDWERENFQILVDNITKLNTNVRDLNKLVQDIGTRKDNRTLR